MCAMRLLISYTAKKRPGLIEQEQHQVVSKTARRVGTYHAFLPVPKVI